LYDLRSPAKAPFPTDRFTIADPAQITGRLCCRTAESVW
jgi:hypothetical protein